MQQLLSRQQQASLPVALITRSLPITDGYEQGIYNQEMVYPHQRRQCAWCGTIFTPKARVKNGRIPRFCGKSCSAKWRMRQQEIRDVIYTPEVKQKIMQRARQFYIDHPDRDQERRQRIAKINPMENEVSRKKCSETLRAIKHRPHVQGGNGRGLTKPQAGLLEYLKRCGPGWQAELPIKTGLRAQGYPGCYKVDIANQDVMIAIEVDGFSHMSLARQVQDKKKEALLISFGWKVLRFWNQPILAWMEAGMPMEGSISTTLQSMGIRPLP